MDQIEGHPIPQDVTGFQFRLVGDMTVKQFAYLVSGLALGWISFTIIPSIFIVKLLIGGIFALVGAILAFVPIDGRPADTMIMLFMKTLTRPTQYSYKSVAQSAPTTHVQGQTPAVPASTSNAAAVQPDEQTVVLSNPSAGSASSQQTGSGQAPTPDSTPNPTPEPEQEEIKQEEEKVEETINQVEQTLEKTKQEETAVPAYTSNAADTNAAAANPALHEKLLALEQQLQEALDQKKQLEDRLIRLEQKGAFVGRMPSTEVIKKTPRALQQASGIPLTPDVPNLISGALTDSRGNVLPQMLVEVKDKDGNPVRAFKTNALGQFASATPLQNGTYTVSFEDPKKQQRFETVEVSVTGDIMEPLSVTSTDARDDLRKELFGAPTPV